MYVTYTGDEFKILFRPATLRQLQDFDAYMTMGMDPLNNSITYKVFAVEPSKLAKTSIINTICGLKLVGTLVMDKTYYDVQPESSQIEMSFEYDNYTDETQFVLVATNTDSHVSSVYDPVNYEVVSPTTVNTAALVCGIVFGILGLAIIVFLIIWIMKLIKAKNAIYENVSNVL